MVDLPESTWLSSSQYLWFVGIVVVKRGNAPDNDDVDVSLVLLAREGVSMLESLTR